MIGQTRLLTTLASAVKRAKVDALSVCAQAKTRQVFRFAYGAIHQALAQESVTVTVKVIDEGRAGVASTNVLEPKSLARCVSVARTIARHSPKLDRSPALPSRHRVATRAGIARPTLTQTPERVVQSLRTLFLLCEGAGAMLAGSLVTGADEVAVCNSAGVACYAAGTVAGAKLVTMYRALSGYASGAHSDIAQLDLEELLRRSLRQSLHRTEPVSPPIGPYEVILEPEAVAELVTWLGYTAFGAKSLAERTSCFAGRLDEMIVSPTLTIYDDGTEPATLQLPFDFEGTPRRRVLLIDRGKASGVVYDTQYGERFGQPSTGHAMPPDEVEGPLPLHLGMMPGTASIEAMIRSCQRGLWIPRFHYVNGLLNPREALMTGLTREGTFLIEHGRVTAPVTTLRFTQSLLEAFRHIRGISRERQLISDPAQELGCAVMPALHLARFTFTGRSER